MKPSASLFYMKLVEEYLAAGYPAVWIKTWEEDRVLDELRKICKKQKLGLQVWSVSRGWVNKTGESEEVSDPVGALEYILTGDDYTAYILLNFHFYLEDQPDVLQRIKDIIPVAKENARHIIFVSCRVNLPQEIVKEIAVINDDLPGIDELSKSLDVVLNSIGKEIEISDRKRLLESALGMTCGEAENAFALAYVKHRAFNEAAIQTVQNEKAAVVRKSGMLEFIPPTHDLDDIGGLHELKRWLKQRKNAFSDEARDFGLPAPRGVLLVGVPGAGKSLTAKAVSASWGIPLLRMDIGRVFGSLVGQSEAQMDSLLEVAEVCAPVVLWIDEIDKGFSGIKSSGSTDSGVTARVLGKFLSWMQDKTAPVFVFATANNVTSLPPEFLRKGRFDELFFVDLPQEEERKEIFSIHLRKRNREPKMFDLQRLVKASEGYGGSEIEEAVISGLYLAFEEGRELSTEDILSSLIESKPLSETMREEIISVREWAKNRARHASGKHIEIVTTTITKRRLTV